jgi:hypothetical protein
MILEINILLQSISHYCHLDKDQETSQHEDVSILSTTMPNNIMLVVVSFNTIVRKPNKQTSFSNATA